MSWRAFASKMDMSMTSTNSSLVSLQLFLVVLTYCCPLAHWGGAALTEDLSPEAAIKMWKASSCACLVLLLFCMQYTFGIAAALGCVCVYIAITLLLMSWDMVDLYYCLELCHAMLVWVLKLRLHGMDLALVCSSLISRPHLYLILRPGTDWIRMLTTHVQNATIWRLHCILRLLSFNTHISGYLLTAVASR